MFAVAAGLIASHAAQYVLFLLSWWAIGRAVLEGHLASGWLWGWALILLCAVPLLMLSIWLQGRLAVGIGALLRRRLLAGALELSPAMISRDGIGGLLGRTIEAESLERLALSGGFASLVLAGFAQSLSMVSHSVILLRACKPRLRGRVMSVRTMAIYGLPLGLLAAGALICGGPPRPVGAPCRG